MSGEEPSGMMFKLNVWCRDILTRSDNPSFANASVDIESMSKVRAGHIVAGLYHVEPRP